MFSDTTAKHLPNTRSVLSHNLPASAAAQVSPCIALTRPSTTSPCSLRLHQQNQQMNTGDPRIPRGKNPLTHPFPSTDSGRLEQHLVMMPALICQIRDSIATALRCTAPASSCNLLCSPSVNPQSFANLHYQRQRHDSPLLFDLGGLAIRLGCWSPLSGG